MEAAQRRGLKRAMPVGGAIFQPTADDRSGILVVLCTVSSKPPISFGANIFRGRSESLTYSRTLARGKKSLAGCAAYFGCTPGSPPGLPGGGMTLSLPPPGGGTGMSRSIPAGGQMTPFDWASLSLSCCPELPLPTGGGSFLTSGGQVTPCWADDCPSPAGCADAVPGWTFASM